MANTFKGLLPDGTAPAALAAQIADIARENGLPGGDIPIFRTLTEAVAWEAANPGRTALTIEPQEPDVDPPTPGTLSATVSDITANLTVTGASDNRAVTGYAFRVGTGVWSAWQVGATYTATGLSPATEYSFQHRVRDGAGNEALGATVTRTTASMAAKTPAQIGSLWGHWDASAPGSLTTAGTAVSAWADTTSAVRTLSQATSAQQPATTTMGGLTAVQFDRTAQDYMRYQDSFTIDSTVGYTLCWIGRFDDPSLEAAHSAASLDAGADITRRTPDGLIQTAGLGGIDGPASVKPAAGEIALVTVTVKSGGPSFVRVSGVSGTQKFTSSGNPGTAFDVGRRTDNSNYASATTGEVWVHDRPLTISELDALRMYAQTKWGAT